MSGFREYCTGHLAREHNIVTLVAYHDACIAKLKRKGAGKVSAVVKAKLEKHERKRRKLEACENHRGASDTCEAQVRALGTSEKKCEAQVRALPC